MNFMAITMTAILIGMVLACLFIFMKEEKTSSMTEMTSFECGFSNMNDKKMPFSTNFIMIVMLFIMFDIEVSIMIPMVMKSNMAMEWASIPMGFLMVLTIILVKEWTTGTVEWNK